jgi:hypothetical protein
MSQSQIRTRNRISLASHAGERGAPAGWIGAIFLHALIVAAVLFTFTHSFPLDITDESAPVVPVDLVTIAPKTNIMAQAKPEPKAKPDITPQPLQPDQLKLQQPPVPQEETAPPPVDTAPVKQQVQAPPLPVYKPQQQTHADTKKPAADPMKALLNNILAPPTAPKNAKAADHNTPGIGSQTALNIDLRNALSSQIYNCYSPQGGTPNAADLVVDFNMHLNPDGSVAEPPQLDEQSAARAASNVYTRAAAEEARRAIIECAPYKLPADQYSAWREFTFHFDPRNQVGQ